MCGSKVGPSTWSTCWKPPRVSIPLNPFCGASLYQSSSIGEAWAFMCPVRYAKKTGQPRINTHCGCLKKCGKYSKCSDHCSSLKGVRQRQSAAQTYKYVSTNQNPRLGWFSKYCGSCFRWLCQFQYLAQGIHHLRSNFHFQYFDLPLLHAILHQ